MEDGQGKPSANNREKCLNFLIEQFNLVRNLRDEMNRDYVGWRVDNIKQKRGFFQHLTILSGAVIGLSSIFGYDRILNITNFHIGLFLNLLFIVVITLYFREVLDKEGNELLSQQDKFNKIINKKKEITNRYLANGIFTKEDIDRYIKEFEMTEESQSLRIENDKLDKERDLRLGGKKDQDFTGELFNFLFIFASFFIFISFIEINLYLCLFVAIIMIGLIFTDSITFFTKKISKLINFLKITKI